VTELIVMTHDHALCALDERIRRTGVDRQVVAVVAAIMTVHNGLPPERTTPDPDCAWCHGSGLYLPDGAVLPQHCHCRCPWCAGCEMPVCDGPCETVAAVGAALGIPGLAAREHETP